MISDVQDIEKYTKGRLMGGKIKYQVGDSWSHKVKDSYKTTFAHYYHKEVTKNPIQGETLIE